MKRHPLLRAAVSIAAVLFVLAALAALSFAKSFWGCAADRRIMYGNLKLLDQEHRSIYSSGGVTIHIDRILSGRLMAIIPEGGPNLLWENKNPETTLWGWKNYGGEKTWIGPQKAWTNLLASGSDWPPPPQFDGDPYEYVNPGARGDMELLSAAVPQWNLRVRRRIGVGSDHIVRVWSRLEKADETAPMPDIRFQNWSVAQFAPASKIYARLCGKGRISGEPQTGWNPPTPLPEPEALADGILRFDLSQTATGKTGCKGYLDADALALEVAGGVLIISHILPPGADPEPDYNHPPERAQIFLSARQGMPEGCEPYMELEWAQPWPQSEHTVEYRFIPAKPGKTAEEMILHEFHVSKLLALVLSCSRN
jgi:hypothetical protein